MAEIKSVRIQSEMAEDQNKSENARLGDKRDEVESKCKNHLIVVEEERSIIIQQVNKYRKGTTMRPD